MPKMVSEIVDCYVFRRRSEGVEVLLLKRAEGRYMGGTWHAVHGRIESGETAWQTALRELREETRLRPVKFYQLDLVNTFYVAKEDAIHCCPSFAAEVDADAEPILNEEHTAYRWLPLPLAMREFFWTGQRRALREIQEDIIVGSSARRHLGITLPNDA
jgi:dATP pyrophosphohydrolase